MALKRPDLAFVSVSLATHGSGIYTSWQKRHEIMNWNNMNDQQIVECGGVTNGLMLWSSTISY